MSIVRMPYASKTDNGAPLQACLKRAAKESGQSEHMVYGIISIFLEQVAVQVSMGHCVSIPGFGIWGGYTNDGTKMNSTPHARVRFYAAKSFSNEVGFNCPVSPKRDAHLKGYASNHRFGSKSTKDTCRVFTAMEAVRRRLKNEAEPLGIKHVPVREKRGGGC